jgi:hypothetical protein
MSGTLARATLPCTEKDQNALSCLDKRGETCNSLRVVRRRAQAAARERVLTALRSPQEGNVRDIQDLLREKEHAIEQVRLEVDALRSVSPLLSDRVPVNSLFGEAGTDASTELVAALRTVAPLLVDETDEFDPGIRARLIEAAESDFNLGTAKRISRQVRHIVGLVGPRFGSSPRSGMTAKQH